MGVQMQQLQLKLDDDAFDDVVFLSHTVDSEYDTPEVLDAYAHKLQADTTRWKFLTGNKADIYLQQRATTSRPRRCDGTGWFPPFGSIRPGGQGPAHPWVLRRHHYGRHECTCGDLKMLLKEEKVKAADAERERRKR